MKKWILKNNLKLKIALLVAPFALSGVSLLSLTASLISDHYNDEKLVTYYSSESVKNYKNFKKSEIYSLYKDKKISHEQYLDETFYWSASESDEEAAKVVYKDNEDFNVRVNLRKANKTAEKVLVATGFVGTIVAAGCIKPLNEIKKDYYDFDYEVEFDK